MKDVFPKWESRAKEDVFLDVRRADEFASGHIPGAIHIPYDRLPEHLHDLSCTNTYYVYCAAGHRSRRASEILLAAGFNNVCCVIESGMADWAISGFPVER